MKRVALLRILGEYGCVFRREGGNHTIFFNPAIGRAAAIPRHNEIDDFLVKKILRELGIVLK